VLAGTEAGEVVAMHLDRAGALAGEPALWSHRVGGPMTLLPTHDGAPLAALLGRPVHGTGARNEQARVQVLLPLNDALAPIGEPQATGFAQFPLATVARGNDVLVFQWAEQQGVAIATMPTNGRVVHAELPRVFYARPPLEGALLGHTATLAPGNVVYDLVTYGEDQGELHGHLAWVPPSGVPIIRRDVLPLRTRLAAAPRALPAADGVSVIVSGEDETGGAIDAIHLRCDLVNAHARSE
jgi:hypothetical protein